MNSHLPVALIPAYKPELSLLSTAREVLESEAFAALVVVDDGSGPSFTSLFSRLEEMGAIVLRHSGNRGKGMALRTGLRHIAALPDNPGVVTLDADGQHLVRDAMAVARRLRACPDSLVIGCRRFDASQDVPLRSRLGNRVTSRVMRIFTGIRLSDTQSGLRGIPASFIPALLRLRTRGYDFELDMLLLAREQGIGLVEVPISTVYLQNNQSSHFNPLLDSMKIYLVFLRFNLASLVMTSVDYALFILASQAGLQLGPSLVLGRLGSWIAGYGLNRDFVFHCGSRATLPCLGRFLAVETVMALLAYAGIAVLYRELGFNLYAAKVLVEGALFVCTFTLQREIVFAPAPANSPAQKPARE